MNKYNKIMDKVKVTDEMHDRIMNNISKRNKEVKKKNWYAYRRYVSVAAGIMLLLVASFMLPITIKDKPNKDIVEVVPEIFEHENIELLSNAVDFDVCELTELPFEVEKVSYISYWGVLAEINYIGLDNQITFRISNDGKENSGIYIEYADVKQVEVDLKKITLKGNEGAYHLAIWNDSFMNYSIYTDKSLDEEYFRDLVNSLDK